MDLIHDPDNRSWISKRVELSTYFQDYANELKSFKPPGCQGSLVDLNAKKTMKFIGLDPSDPDAKETFQKLKEHCDIDNLTIEGEPTPHVLKYEPIPIPKDAPKHLKTMALQKIFLEACEKKKCYQIRRATYLRHQNNNWFESMPSPPTRISPLFNEKEILVVVRVYAPLKQDSEIPLYRAARRYCQELHLLGANKLSDLRDCIKCTLDYSIPEDMSEDPTDSKPRKIGKERYKSGFFFIDNCFYNDMRWPECIDYSEVIREWAAKPSRKLGPFRTAKMEDTLIRDLAIRVGYPYVYVHQGHHEHLFSFIDVRLLSADDPQKPSAYPFERCPGNKRGKYCMVCRLYVAKWITTNNERVPEDPFFFCDSCFKSFNYGDEGQKIGNFKASKYFDINAL